MRLSSNLGGWKNSTEHNLKIKEIFYLYDGAYKEKQLLFHFLLLESVGLRYSKYQPGHLFVDGDHQGKHSMSVIKLYCWKYNFSFESRQL